VSKTIANLVWKVNFSTMIYSGGQTDA